jgi:predicted RNase H-like nuclease (RuvC/YqgF family)
VSKGRQIIIGIVGIGLVGIAVEEHWSRRVAQRRYHEAVNSRQRLELQFAEMRSTHERLVESLKKEKQRSQDLSYELRSARTQLEEAVGRLAAEGRSVRELQERLAAMQQQMDQLQGELAMTLQTQGGTARAGEPQSPVQLERVVVSDGQAAASQGRILSVHKEWNFVVADIGWNQVKIGETVSIFRNEHLLAKARVERVQEGVCAASVLPEWASAEIRVNDLVRVL